MPSSVASLNFQNTKSPELRELITEGSMLSPMVSHADLSSSSTVDSQKSRAPDSRCGSCNGVKDEFPIDNTIRGIDGPKSVVVKTSIARIGVKPLKTVAFDISTFVHDPPQLIPAKHPKPGCVIVNEDGKIDIRDAKRNTLTSSLLSSSTKNNSCPVVNSLRSNTIKTPILNAVESGSAVHNTISVPGVKSGMPKNSLSLSNSSSADTSVSIAKTTKPSSLPLASNKDQPNSKSSSLSSNRKTLEVSRNSSETSLTSLLDNELDSFTPSRHNSTATLLPLNPTKKATGAPSESLIPVLNEHTIADEEIDQRLARVISHNRAITTDVNLVNSASEDGHGNNRGMINDPDYIPPEDRDGDLVVDIQTTLASIYARCCHLREILSLPLTLNQIKGKTLRDLPLKTLRLINPRPTMIEILSFCDFIKIIPIKQLSFDNLTLSDEQIYMIFSALLWLNELERVSLKNMQFTTVNNTLNENIKENDISTKTDSEASSGAYNSWYYLCLFLLKNKSLKRLDISQTESKNAEMVHHYHWPLFIDALEKRGGIDQIVINGCVNPLSNDSTPELSLASEKNFHNFLYRACMPKTRRMGMANNPNITSRHLQIFYEWFNLPECKLEVIDFSNNDNMFKDAKDIELLTESISLSQESANRLRFVSFRNNGLSNDIQAEGKLDSISRLLDSLSLLPTLQLLDFSSNPKLFTNPTFFAKFSEIFSKPLTELDLIKNGPNINELSSDNGLFVQLRRLHLNDNGMRNRDLIILFETFLNSTSLFQISLLNNIEIESDTESAECTFPSKPLDSNKRYLISIILSILTLKLSKNIFNIDLFSEDFVKKNSITPIETKII
ncbi:hypothetical protein NADFUDRAFT_68688 [Nadsonia fulvescens var. elongata DSM 6958]|uniref:RNI-like protein n=1 Tax=Nadsonia fulvescens var. elongata DSM 6958 TaxID=857566 RepID=A0A1E3PSS5_9ASCO|nr:hypothetical protein NADFUDRAFT_68688 [Nadsonia fulvescens var. elongata DSM 6958]